MNAFGPNPERSQLKYIDLLATTAGGILLIVCFVVYKVCKHLYKEPEYLEDNVNKTSSTKEISPKFEILIDDRMSICL